MMPDPCDILLNQLATVQDSITSLTSVEFDRVQQFFHRALLKNAEAAILHIAGLQNFEGLEELDASQSERLHFLLRRLNYELANLQWRVIALESDPARNEGEYRFDLEEITQVGQKLGNLQDDLKALWP